jgi:hypothetical protein
MVRQADATAWHGHRLVHSTVLASAEHWGRHWRGVTLTTALGLRRDRAVFFVQTEDAMQLT